MPHNDNIKVLKFTKTYADFADTSNSHSINLGALPYDNIEVIGAYLDVTTGFYGVSGSPIVTCTLSLGDSTGSPYDQIIAASSCLVSHTQITGIGIHALSYFLPYDTSKNLYTRIVANAGFRLSGLTQGVVDIYIAYVRYNY